MSELEIEEIRPRRLIVGRIKKIKGPSSHGRKWWAPILAAGISAEELLEAH